jgi:cellulose synthase/poly-beta-1,6-N-acetylglucosamine synthase-like glycosyltransferase
MHLISQTITYIFLFLALYVEVFFLISYFEIRGKEKIEAKVSTGKTKISDNKLPSVSIIVPAWNEGNTILKTIFSILRLNYPKDKLFVYIVDDGSTDNTWKIIQRFARNKQVALLHKENGGKYTALNYALEKITTDLVGCLDADSFVHPEALRRIVAKFAEDNEIMAVTPSTKVFEPKGFLGLIQKAEYMFGIFIRKANQNLNAIYITPGPFSIFRISVFKEIGGYRHAHGTEDNEIAMRMQKNHMKISNVHDAYVFTVVPTKIKPLLKQRLRWVYGFLKNAVDYRDMFFRPQYGNLGMIVLPAAGFSIISSLYFFFVRIWSVICTLGSKINEIYTVGFHPHNFNFDLFYVNTNIMMFIAIIAIGGMFLLIGISRTLANEDKKFGWDSVLYILFYTFISPIWMVWALYNFVFAKATKWR